MSGLPASSQIIVEGQGSDITAAQAEDATGRIAVLRALDKVTARTVDLEVPVNEPVRFGTLVTTVRYCRTRPPEEPPETFAFLEIEEATEGRVGTRIFTGWMIASSPALNPLEHPVYAIWVVGCRHPEPPAVETEADTEADSEGAPGAE
ncbi:MAG: DUF2155 domain-containing protein [Minwuia sp.]|nr:DUF2155 domain-containing protein [Minwuia sp.]